MVVSSKLIVGLAVVGCGIAGLVYSIPIVSNSIASKVPVYMNSDVHGYSNSMLVYVATEIGSAAILTLGIALSAFGYAE
jgi:hypothetical protein